MPTQILATKFYLPLPGPAIVPRPRLFTLLDKGLQRKLTLVSAPPGYGKTTLLSAWITDRRAEERAWPQSERPTRFGWISLDSGDNDPQRFLAYLTTAIQAKPTEDRPAGEPRGIPDRTTTATTSLPGFTERLISPDIETLLLQLLNKLAQSQEHIALVLDDFYLVREEQVHRLLAGFIERMPASCHLFIATRSDPILPLARLRVSGQLGEIRGDELRFTIQEAGELFQRSLGFELSQADIAALVTRTEGWVAGLQMAGLSMQNRPDAAGFITRFTGTDRYIFEYLVEEVLSCQTSQVHEFLLKTSILDQLSAPLCQALIDGATSAATAAETLAYLEHANLFLIPLGNDRTWYRYHHLFAELLRATLRQTWPEQIPGLHLRASHWYEAQGIITGAIQHTLAAGEVARVTHLIANNVLALIEHGELTTLLRQIQTIPEDNTGCQPWLCIAQAWAMAYAGQLLGIEPLLRDVEQRLDNEQLAPGNALLESTRPAFQLRGHIAAIRAYVEWIQGNFDCAIDLAWQADGYLLDDEPTAQAINLTTLGTSLQYSGQLHQAAQVLARAIRLSRETEETHATLLAGASLAYVQWLLGDLRQALQICQDLLEIAGQYARHSGTLMPAACSVYAIQSAIHCERNELETALQEARLGLALSLEWGQADNLVVNYLYLSRVLSATGNLTAAREALTKGQQVAGQVSLWFHDLVDTYVAEMHIKSGELDEAAAWSREHRLSPEDAIPYHRESEYRMLAWLLIQQGRATDALLTLEQILETLEPSGSVRSLLHARLLQALAYQAAGKQDTALSSLEKALSLGEEGGFLRSYLDLGEPIHRLLEDLRDKADVPSTSTWDSALQERIHYLERILSAFPGGAPQPPPTQAARPVLQSKSLPRATVESLSEREMDVLHYLAGHLTVPEIAEALYLSPYTVRSHVKSIYGKLNAHNRSQAVQRAQELHLL